MNKHLFRLTGVILTQCCWLAPLALPQGQQSGGAKFEISFPASAHAGPITGRIFVALANKESPEPMGQVGGWNGKALLFGVDVEQLQPGQTAVVDARALGYPLSSLREVPAGDYFAQALVNVYTQFPRADGHTIWAHMDQWEGQRFNRSPGNVFSEVQRVHLDPASGYSVRLELGKVIPPVQVPPDTVWLKRIKFQSQLLTKFWGRPMYLGATILLPKGYDEQSSEHYPVIYLQSHFTQDIPFDFRDSPATSPRERAGFEFYQQWTSDAFPRMIVVTFQHATPYFDDSYAVNSANNGPFGDALMRELIPYVEEHFRIIRAPYARILTGGSTGGWESLALQLYHPDFFGGTWTFNPDPIDFRRYQLVNVYDDESAFQAPGFEYTIPERPMMRTPEGQVVQTMRQASRLEEVLGSKGRSGQQFDAWESVYGPVGEDGYPRPLWDKMTGKIDHQVALYMRDHGYDLTYYLKTNWATEGPQLKGKLHLFSGDMDSFYLNLALYMFEDFLKNTDAEATFTYGRPMKGHGWRATSNAELVKAMAAQVQRNAPQKAASAAR